MTRMIMGFYFKSLCQSGSCDRWRGLGAFGSHLLETSSLMHQSCQSWSVVADERNRGCWLKVKRSITFAHYWYWIIDLSDKRVSYR